MLKLASLFVDKKYNENLSLVIHKSVYVKRGMQEMRESEGWQRKRCAREGYVCEEKTNLEIGPPLLLLSSFYSKIQ